MIWFSLYVVYIYFSLILIAYSPSNKNILHGFPRSTYLLSALQLDENNMLDLDISIVMCFTHRLQDVILEIWYVERILQWVVVLGGRFSSTNRIPIRGAI